MIRKQSVLFLLLFTFCLFPITASDCLELGDRERMLEIVTLVDGSIDSTDLAKAVKIGELDNPTEFYQALKERVLEKIDWASSANEIVVRTSLSEEITTLANKIAELDKDVITNVEMDENRQKELYKDITQNIPASYDRAMKLCKLFNPKSNTNDHNKLNKEIDAYLNSIGDTAVIKYALQCTNSTMQDLKKNWFGVGRGFEHVIAGETKGSKVSGYHWWYRFYADERAGSAFYTKSLEGLDDPKIFTGTFQWDPDGNGNSFSKCYKKKGGFCNNVSAEALVALGHIAMETAKKNGSPSSFRFMANINGNTYNWQVFASGQTIRSLYPMVTKLSTKELKEQAVELLVDDILNPAVLESVKY